VPNPIFECTGKYQGHWIAQPTSWGKQGKGPAGRISTLDEAAGLDIQAMYPAQEVRTEAAKQWTMVALLKAAEACHNSGRPFGIGPGTTSDSVDMIGGLFAAFGAARDRREDVSARRADQHARAPGEGTAHEGRAVLGREGDRRSHAPNPPGNLYVVAEPRVRPR